MASLLIFDKKNHPDIRAIHSRYLYQYLVFCHLILSIPRRSVSNKGLDKNKDKDKKAYQYLSPPFSKRRDIGWKFENKAINENSEEGSDDSPGSTGQQRTADNH